MTNTAPHFLTHPTAGETLVFKPQADGSVIVDHKFPRGIKNVPGVGRYGRRMSRKNARAKWANAVSVGWETFEAREIRRMKEKLEWMRKDPKGYGLLIWQTEQRLARWEH